ncbi:MULTISPECIES: 2-oxoacid:acceptor oxidoreductase family protein [unclassified Pseudofrankia]|uniref:2-oxoacid:acceptor oxidoreductase family protein n=1 Tax=unclassified Pseudofrankia TaxID=2994372 RepID=UPI0008D9FBF0|nr:MULTISPECIES: 2-oxoacid:acceptor oxidoreductase family protein [unclassified Pseudofrankia]MDT3446690.1 2-oxoacid:acceptor oxidoreductase family protein [Pseudofrankia sp. BMG5.37]OHV57555.1 2-oxoacid:acceptor oxidoreductase [Pseudofrankia sp. BMG5.36]
MFATRIHGLGGQGVLAAAEMLAVAAFSQGGYAQAFPSFGPERAGVPVAAFCRVDDEPIRRREPVLHPDALIVQDPRLLHQVDVFEGMRSDGYVLVNSSHDVDELGLDDLAVHHGLLAVRLQTVPATEIARRTLGHLLPNTALLGAFAALTGTVTLDGVETAILERFGGQFAEDNVEAARTAYGFVRYALGDRLSGTARASHDREMPEEI